MNHAVQLIECPRDAMQGWKNIIPTVDKIRYLNALLRVGFDTLDFGSFVSPHLIPQMADTAEVIKHLDKVGSKTKLLAIIANSRGAEDAVQFDQIEYLGFPFSVSATFQQRNTNSTMQESLIRVEEINKLCEKHGKSLVVYLSMGFGNPYGDEYNLDILKEWMISIHNKGVKILSIADTVGLASAAQISEVVKNMLPSFPLATVGVHLHSAPYNQTEKIEAAFQAGCRRFDGAIGGIGGCPMADDELVGNMDSLEMVNYFKKQGALNGIDPKELDNAIRISKEIFI